MAASGRCCCSLLLLLAPLRHDASSCSFNSFDFYKGIGSDFSLANYADVLGDSYFYEIFWPHVRHRAGNDADLRGRRCAAGMVS